MHVPVAYTVAYFALLIAFMNSLLQLYMLYAFPSSAGTTQCCYAAGGQLIQSGVGEGEGNTKNVYTDPLSAAAGVAVDSFCCRLGGTVMSPGTDEVLGYK